MALGETIGNIYGGISDIYGKYTAAETAKAEAEISENQRKITETGALTQSKLLAADTQKKLFYAGFGLIGLTAIFMISKKR